MGLAATLAYLAGSRSYDPVSYWARRRDPNNAAGKSAEVLKRHVDFLRQLLPTPGTFLEYGPGVGRTFAAYPKGSIIDAVDLSDTYFPELKKHAARCRVELRNNFIVQPGEPLPFSDQEYAVAIASQVFLHVQPSAIKNVIDELLRVAGKVLVISAYKHGSPVHTASRHCFNHDYIKIVSQCKGIVNNCVFDDGTIFFAMQRGHCD